MNSLFSFLKKTVHPLLGYAFVASFGAVAIATTVHVAQIDPAAQTTAALQKCAAVCTTSRSECALKAGTNTEALALCEKTNQQCTLQCLFKSSGTISTPLPVNINRPAPTAGTGTNTECASKCRDLATKCSANTNANSNVNTDATTTTKAPDACGRQVQECLMHCDKGTDGMRKEMTFGSDEKRCVKNAASMQKMFGTLISQLKRVKETVSGIEKQKLPVPTELKDALANVDTLAANLRGAHTCDDLAALNLTEKTDTINESLTGELITVQRLARIKQMYARVTAELKRLDALLASDKKLLTTSKIDLSGPVADFEKALLGVKTAFEAVKTKIQSGDTETGFAELEKNVFDAMQEARESHDALRQILTVAAQVTRIGRETANSQRIVDGLKKKGKDTTAVQATLDMIKTKYEELKTAATAQPIDPQAIHAILSSLKDLRDTYVTAFNALKGIKEPLSIDEGITLPTVTVPNVEQFVVTEPTTAPSTTESSPVQ